MIAKFLENLYFPFRIFTFLAIFFLIGIFISSFIAFDYTKTWPIALFLIPLLLFTALINYFLGNRFLVLLSFGIAVLLGAVTFYAYFDNIHTPTLSFGKKSEISGKIVIRPQVDFKQQKIVLEIDGQNHKKTLILINAPHYPEYKFGQSIKFEGAIEEPRNFSADFDYKGYLKGKLIYGIVNRPGEITITSSSNNASDHIISKLYDLSATFENSINRILPEPHASLASGILLGSKRNIPDALMNNLQITGLTHIIALSGFNVTIIIIVLAELLLGIIGRRRTFWLGTILIILFVIMTGNFSSAVRAAIFSVLLLFGRTYGRQADQTNIMLLAAIAMVVINPFILRSDLGFQFSFLAFMGLIYLSPWLSGLFERKFKFIPKSIRGMAAETLSAQIFVAPIILLQFGLISTISPLANVLVVWIVPYAMAFIFFAGLLGLIFAPLGILAGCIAWPSLEYMIWIVDWLSKVPAAAIKFK